MRQTSTASGLRNPAWASSASISSPRVSETMWNAIWKLRVAGEWAGFSASTRVFGS